MPLACFNLQGFSHNLTAYHHARLSLVVSDLIQDFNRAYTQIVESESAYSAASSSLQEAIDALPAHVEGVRDVLANYEVASGGVRDSELKTASDLLFRSINESLLAGRTAIATALPVSETVVK